MKLRILFCMAIVTTAGVSSPLHAAEKFKQRIAVALQQAGANRGQLERALKNVPADEREGLRFLIANMPSRDLQRLSAAFLLENVHYAYRAWRESPWKKRLTHDVFLNSVLPYASINEKRDNWRKDFFERFRPMIKNTKTPAEAAALLNRKIFPLLKVRYSRKRRKADQSPYESIETGTASCTGLSVLLIDACRAVGVPARFAGTPLWSNNSGNHSWVEVWDKGWHFTGAAEPTGNNLDRAWFSGRASTAVRTHRLHAIYAVSFKRTPLTFPLVWDRRNNSVFAVNVTNRYTRKTKKLPKGIVRVMFRVVNRHGNDRVAAALHILDANGKPVFAGRSNDERFDANDHLTAELKRGRKYRLEIRIGNSVLKKTIEPKRNDQLFNFRISADKK